MSYDNTNRGQMWRNNDKQKDTDRDFQGSINIDGVEYWLSGWSRKQGDNPKSPSVRFSVQRKDQTHEQGYQNTQQVMQQAPQQQQQQRPQQQRAPQQRQQQQQAPQQDNFKDDIPW